MVKTRQYNGWLIPFLLAGLLFGLVLVTGYSPASSRFDSIEDLDYGQQFRQVIETIHNSHVNPDAVESERALFATAIEAIMLEIGDKHGKYYSPEEFKQLNETLRPTDYGGLGITIMPSKSGLLILHIFDGSPLREMAIREGDVITAVGQVGGMMLEWNSDDNNMSDMVDGMLGTPATNVSVAISRVMWNSESSPCAES